MSEQKARPELRDIQRLWCQHCKAMQKTNNTVVECWYNPLDEGRENAFCASNEDACKSIIAFFPDTEEAKVAWIKALMKEGILVAEPKDLAGIGNRLVEEAKREVVEKIVAMPHGITHCDIIQALKQKHLGD